MSYRSIVVHVNNSSRAEERIRVAARIALAEQAHLIGVAPTGFSLLRPGMDASELGIYVEQTLIRLRGRADEAAARFDAMSDRLGLRAFEHRIVDDEDGYAISLHARYADLVVVGQANGNDPTIDTSMNFPEHVLLNAGRPTLIVPFAGTFEVVGGEVLVAWNASREGARAVTDALPFLQRAQNVRVIVINPAQTLDGHGAEPGADVALYLARHGVKVEVHQERSVVDVANALLSRAADFGSDLIVMGGYGHSKFRETLLGGVTRTILEQMTVPVLMSH